MNDDVEHRDPWLGRLSDYVDGDLAPRERRRLERHLDTCAGCRAAVEDLRRIATMASDLNRPLAPHHDLWPGVQRRLTARRPGRAAWLSLGGFRLRPQMAAAVVLVGCIGALWLAYLHRGPARQGTVPSVTRSVHQDADDEYQKTVASLQREAEARLTLDPRVVDVLNENLAELDAAIASYREALATEPGDEQLRNRLAAARQSKLEMLQQAVALAAEGSQ